MFLRYSLLILFLCFIAACTNTDETQFRFASSGEFYPFSFVSDQGELQGYDIEVGKEIAKRLNLTPAPEMYKFAGLIEGVKSGRFDAAIASHTITEERRQHLAFSTPYYYSGPMVFTRINEQFEGPEDLKNKKIAASKGSTYVTIAKTFTDDVSIYDSDITALEALQNGRHDLVITDEIAGAMAIKRGLKISPSLKLGVSEQAIAVSHKNPELLEKINHALQEMRDDGTLAKIGEKFLDKDISK